MEGLSFTIPMPPKPQPDHKISATPYFCKKTKKWRAMVKTYKIGTQVEYEKRMHCYMKHFVNEMIKGPVILKVIGYMPIPKSMPKYKQKEAMAGDLPHMKVPDNDNMQKQLCDCMTQSLSWIDDKIVQAVISVKRYDDGKGPRWRVAILPWLGFEDFCDRYKG